MRGSVDVRELLRNTVFESFEERLALSAQAVGDFFLDQSVLDELSTGGDGRIQLSLADVHEASGVSYVHDNFGFDGEGQTVVVIDSGIAYDHYALGGGLGSNYRVQGGWDFTEENDADPYDDGPAGFHGTHVAGIIGSSDATHTGVAPGVDLVGLRVFNDQGAGFFNWVEDSLRWVHDHRHDFESPITTVNMSLGATWNSDQLPSWATLEDELAQLHADGIFVSVAAGNSFQDYQEPGLSYPAVSQYVVPVASVTNEGNFSYFSQRESRVLAAPGHSITSTAPDYLFSFDGVTDDFATASGTSMAAPYVAGASVLVRQAMDFFGYTAVTQDTIYDHLRATADTFYDPDTSDWYSRLNLGRAVDALAPDDDYGSIENPHNIGRLVDSTSVSGIISQLNDSDSFTFTAHQAGRVTVPADLTHELTPNWQVDGENITVSDGLLQFDVVAGQEYSVSLSTVDGLGYYDLEFSFDAAATDWGTITQNVVSGVRVSSNDAWYEFTANRTGILTAEGLFSHRHGNVDLELYRLSGELVSASHGTLDHERVDAEVQQGETLLLRAIGANDDVSFRLTNLLRVDGNQVTITGTSENDHLAIDLAESPSVAVNGVGYSLSSLHAWTINADGGVGTDTLQIVGSEVDEQVVAAFESIELRSTQYDLIATSVEDVFIDGSGGQNVLNLIGSHETDVFVATATAASLTSAGRGVQAQGFQRVTAVGNGGDDIAHLYGTQSDDVFVASQTGSSLVGDGFTNHVRDFHRVYATAGNGGNDLAYLHGTAHDDVFVANQDGSSLDGGGRFNHAGNFDRVFAFAGSGGYDLTYLHGTASDDVFIATEAGSSLEGGGVFNHARDFSRVFAFGGSSGNDVAYLHGTASDDIFIATQAGSSLEGAGVFNHARNFDQVHALAGTGGDDIAYLHGTSADEELVATPDGVSLSSSEMFNYARRFDRVNAYAGPGGEDAAYLYGSDGDDLLITTPQATSLEGIGFYHYARGFARVTANAGKGHDEAFMHDSASDDTFTGSATASSLSGVGFHNESRGFDEVNVHSSNGDDQAHVHDTLGPESLVASSDSFSVVGGDFAYRSHGFATVTLYHVGGDDTAEISAVDFVLQGDIFW